MNKIEAEARAIADSGYSEIILTGIHIGSYGKDLDNGNKLIDVLETVSRVSGGIRIRLGSLEPVMITEEFTKRAKKLSGLCPQFHLSLQSGCDKTLRAMRRHYTAADFKRAVTNLRDAFPDAAITTDLIVGFPVRQTLILKNQKGSVRKSALLKCTSFLIRSAEGTAAALLPTGSMKTKSQGERT